MCVIVQEKRLYGIVMFADDSYMHTLELFDGNCEGVVSVWILFTFRRF